jgi:hypothetical protein
MIFLFFIYIINQIICISEIDLDFKPNIIYKFPKISIKKSQIYSKLFKKNFTINDDEEIFIYNNYSLINAKIKFGSELEEFQVIFDTGSINLWIAKNGCKSSSGIPLTIKTFNPESSSSIKKTSDTFNQEYVTGYCRGYYYIDYINFAEKNISMKFGLAEIADFDIDEASGIVGISRKSDNNDNNILLFYQLKNQKKINDYTFSLYKQPDKNIFTLYFDGYHKNFTDKKINGNRGSCDLVDSQNIYKILWACNLDLIYFGKAKKNLDDSYILLDDPVTIFDTGSNFIFLSEKYKNSFLNYLPNNECDSTFLDSGYFIFCLNISNVPDINFIINKKSYLLPKEKIWFMTPVNDSYIEYVFVLNIIFQKENFNLIGTPFFEIYHTAFSQTKKKLSFFNSNKNYIIDVNTFWILYKSYIIFIIIILAIILVLVIIIIIIRIRRRKLTKQIRNPFLITN